MWDFFWNVVEWLEANYAERHRTLWPTDCDYCWWWRGHFTGMIIGAVIFGVILWLRT